MKASPSRPRNDPRQYDDLAPAWWDRKGPFAMLHWIAASRAELIPLATTESATLVDLACGAGLLAPHVADKGYTHVGIDITMSALTQAQQHGVAVVHGDVTALPFADASADVVCAGEILEHVVDIDTVIAEACRVLRPGGLFVADTLANTALARFIAVTVAERIPGGAPPGIHDPALFVDRTHLRKTCAQHGVDLQLRGLRPSIRSFIAWKRGKVELGRMVSTPMTAVLFQAWGRKAL